MIYKKSMNVLLMLCLTFSSSTMRAYNQKNIEVIYHSQPQSTKASKYPDVYYTLKKLALITGVAGAVCALPILVPQVYKQLKNPPQSNFDKFRVSLDFVNHLSRLACNIFKLSK